MTNIKTTELMLVEVFTLQAVIGHVQNTAGALTHPPSHLTSSNLSPNINKVAPNDKKL